MQAIFDQNSQSNSATSAVLSVLRESGMKSASMNEYYATRFEMAGKFFAPVTLDLERSGASYEMGASQAIAVQSVDIPGLLDSWLNSSGTVDIHSIRYKLGTRPRPEVSEGVGPAIRLE